ncbi:MAG: sensor histidine kinase [Actinomycetia bacterium]|nr:sensor histidine kinase [Actinomycetes bacterium]
MTADKRMSRFALSNWPVRWKVLAIVVVPLVLAAVFGGLRIYSSVTAAVQLRGAAERAEMVPAVVDYLAALEDTMIAATGGGDTQAALTIFDSRRTDLRQQLADTEVPDSVGLATNTLLDDGQDLLGTIMGNAEDLRVWVENYAALLIAADTAITGLVAGDTDLEADGRTVRSQGDALAYAVGARGQMVMQQMLVNRGADLPEPVLRSTMVTLAGVEPAIVSAMSAFLGAETGPAAALRSALAERMLVMSDPASVLVGNPALLASQQVTRDIAAGVIAETAESIPAAVDQQADDARFAAIRDSALVVAAIAIALLLVAVAARSLVLPLRTLRDNAVKLAHRGLAGEVEHARSDGTPIPLRPFPVHTSDEIGQVAHAVDELREQAVQFAGEQAQLQFQVTEMFDTLSRRNRSLIDEQLTLIDQLERTEEDPGRLESLVRIDQLAARMQRIGANMLVLAGERLPHEHAGPVALTALVNAAASETEDCSRVTAAGLPGSEIAGAAGGDLVHLLAELLDNALRYSPSDSQVTVSAVHTGSGGLVLEVSDNGRGMTESDLQMANIRLQCVGDDNSYTARHMGLFVVARLANQHGMVVRLRATVAGEPGSGITAGVYVPAEQFVARDTPAPDNEPEEKVSPGPPASQAARPPVADDELQTSRPVRGAESEDAIYNTMRSESPVDPHEVSRSADLSWRSVWDHGWSETAAESDPVVEDSAEGLPRPQPG